MLTHIYNKEAFYDVIKQLFEGLGQSHERTAEVLNVGQNCVHYWLEEKSAPSNLRHRQEIMDEYWLGLDVADAIDF